MNNRTYHKRAVVRKGLAVLLACVGTVAAGWNSTHAALLDGLLEGVSESLAERVTKKGEKLIVGNFYPPERPDAHGPIGTMGEHTHNEGEFMTSYRFMQMHMERNRIGTGSVSDAAVLNRFMVAPTDMTTEMHMFGAMYGFNNTVSLTAMIPYAEKRMNHITRMGVRFKTTSGGFGDLRLGSLWRLYAVEAPSIGAHRFHLNFAVGLPTGDIKATDNTPAGPDVRLPYPMQLGSGTVDLFPGITYAGGMGDFSWGVQFLQTLRLGRNTEGYSVGDAHRANGFGAYRWSDWMSTSVRLDWHNWENYDGRDPNLTPAMVPTADPKLRGGQRLNLLGGINILLPEWMELENRLAVEAGAPIYQRLHGPQLEMDWMIFVGWQLIK